MAHFPLRLKIALKILDKSPRDKRTLITFAFGIPCLGLPDMVPRERERERALVKKCFLEKKKLRI